ncbi:MarR family transcriptional regulator [Thermopolyspora sp. NPDC052614]|uniref:MarR family winged helix-turn-helix transcriptional regulator n=1 Tax=Thermopolyspora sp. NPDC052614 TaxID=3155682 RepID=UPI0034464163
MASRNRRHVAFRHLYESFVDMMTLLNLPALDQELLVEAGVDLDLALFRVIVGVQRFGPIGVVELAERAGRDHTTISRQVAKLAELGLVERRPSPADRRVKEAVITDAGRRVTDALEAARHRLIGRAFADWNDEDLVQFERLMRRCVDSMLAMSAVDKDEAEKKEDGQITSSWSRRRSTAKEHGEGADERARHRQAVPELGPAPPQGG